MRRTLLPLAALITALGLLVSGAAPAAATPGAVSAGTFSIFTGSVVGFGLAPGTGPCPGTVPLTVDVVMSSATAGTATLGISGVFYSNAGTNYFLVGSGSAPVTISGGTMSVGAITITGMNVYGDGGGTCTPVQARCGQVAIGNLNLAGPWSGTVAPPDLTGTVTLDKTGITGGLAAAGCVPPFSDLNGKAVSVTGLAITF